MFYCRELSKTNSLEAEAEAEGSSWHEDEDEDEDENENEDEEAEAGAIASGSSPMDTRRGLPDITSKAAGEKGIGARLKGTRQPVPVASEKRERRPNVRGADSAHK